METLLIYRHYSDDRGARYERIKRIPNAWDVDAEVATLAAVLVPGSYRFAARFEGDDVLLRCYEVEVPAAPEPSVRRV